MIAHILFGPMGSGKNFHAKYIVKHYKCEFFDGDDVIPHAMMEKVLHRPLTREEICNYVTSILAPEIIKKLQGHRNLAVAQALYSNQDRIKLAALLKDANIEVVFYWVKTPWWRNIMQLLHRENKLRWIIYWFMNIWFFEKPTHKYLTIE